MAEVITNKVRVGISACAFGCPVRYNGHGFDSLSVLGRERSDFVFTPVCPECLAGLGVPRTPIHLTGTGAEVLAGEAQVRDRRGHDVTERRRARLRGRALGAAPSRRRRVHREGGVAHLRAREGASRQAAHRAARVPGSSARCSPQSGYFLIPDEALANPLLWWDARRRLHAWLWLREREIATARDLYDAWHVLKFVVQETDRPRADAHRPRARGTAAQRLRRAARADPGWYPRRAREAVVESAHPRGDVEDVRPREEEGPARRRRPARPHARLARGAPATSIELARELVDARAHLLRERPALRHQPRHPPRRPAHRRSRGGARRCRPTES